MFVTFNGVILANDLPFLFFFVDSAVPAVILSMGVLSNVVWVSQLFNYFNLLFKIRSLMLHLLQEVLYRLLMHIAVAALVKSRQLATGARVLDGVLK